MITSRTDLKEGMLVIVKDGEDEKRGFIKTIITKNNAKKGIQVELTNGHVGRVKEIVKKSDLKREQNIIFNKFLSSNNIYSVWDNVDKTFLSFIIYNKNTVFLFTDKKEAQLFLKKIKPKLKNKNTNINILNKRRTVVENIEHLNPEYVILNKTMRVSWKDFQKREKFFNNL